MTTLENYIKDISNLPKLVVENYQKKHGILLESHQEKKLISEYTKAHYWVGKWLEYYLLNKTNNQEELKFSKGGQLYKSRAEAVIATLNLAQEVLVHKQLDPKWQNLIEVNFNNDPGFWWYCIQWENCIFVLEEIGLLKILTNNPLMSVTNFVSCGTSLYQALGNPKNLQIVQIPFSSITPYRALFHTAGLISLLDIEFRNGCYHHWLSKHIRYANHIKRTPELKGLVLLPNGELRTLRAKHRKLAKQLGFCNENVTKN